ncbi:phage tail-type lysozyme domain-containing protein [Cereibacter sphaeroides]|uniref:phage tail tip lysozyme n=1 Tax=Cereibacter sphaeroides TaxID=1063 RepID=UPI001F35A353|nr:phage tail tip lysozyme [Cereibacter sphaeroides]MCE6958288.1 phage tail-type lysozyme domain-containing protein [Cereibacter sphaeroides]MCE6971898.1 phage tail-type lysozyme domain-containing protein [Cereibacter sphaeroides]
MRRSRLLAGLLLLLLFFVEPQVARAETIPERLIADLQEDFALRDYQAVAIAGNLAQETGNFRTLGSSRSACFGYSQWTGKRRTAFFRHADSLGSRTSYAANYGFMAKELRGPYARVLERLRRTRSLEEATRVFMTGYLAPNPRHGALAKRIAFAKNYANGAFGGAGCLPEKGGHGTRIPACAAS